MSALNPEQQLVKMREDWDARARENARHFVNTEKENWSDEEFRQSGERTVAEDILTDMINICQGKDPKQMRVLEIGCGAGRVTRALAGVFGEVFAVDISGEMVAQAKEFLKDRRNAHVFQNNGTDLSVLNGQLAEGSADFAYSTIVFQHIPSREVIETYVREVHRLLRPGGLFKFQVQGYVEQDGIAYESSPEDTWLGVTYSDEQAVALAESTGFEPRHRHGAGDQYFWLWFFKR
jgi:SAM-dependent methyltransferase